MQIKQESLKDILSEPEWARKKHMREYAFNLIRRDISHIQIQADMRQANSQELTRLLDELSSTLNYYS